MAREARGRLNGKLLPFDGAGGLGGDVVDHAVDAADFVHDAVGDALEDLGGKLDPVGGHAVFRVHGADAGGVGVGALVAHHAHAHDRQQHREALPDFVVEAGGLDFGDYDFVGFLKQGHAFRGDFAEDAHGESRAREGLAAEDLFGHGEVAADAADFVFEEVAQGLDELELHEFGQAADVVMALDGLARAADAAGLDDVGIERALDQPVDSTGFLGDARGFVVENGDELRADALALDLGVGDAGQLFEEAGAGVHGHDIEAQLVAQVLLHALKFVFAQDAVIDEDAGELRADCFVDQHGRDRGIDSAGEAADDVPGADLLADGGDGGLDEVGRSPVAAGGADIEDEISNQLRTKRGVVNFGMELDGPNFARFVGDSGEGVLTDGDAAEAGGKLLGLVTVAHPDVNGWRQPGEQLR